MGGRVGRVRRARAAAAASARGSRPDRDRARPRRRGRAAAEPTGQGGVGRAPRGRRCRGKHAGAVLAAGSGAAPRHSRMREPGLSSVDGSKRLLGGYREASWSPFGHFVVAARPNELVALEAGRRPPLDARAAGRALPAVERNPHRHEDRVPLAWAAPRRRGQRQGRSPALSTGREPGTPMVERPGATGSPRASRRL